MTKSNIGIPIKSFNGHFWTLHPPPHFDSFQHDIQRNITVSSLADTRYTRPQRQLPNWTKFTSVTQAVSAPDSSFNSDSINATHLMKSSELAPVYSSPSDASKAYRAGLLKSDLLMAANQASIRVAFRYVIDQKEKEDQNDYRFTTEKTNNMYLCWIDHDGMPHKFYKLDCLDGNMKSDTHWQQVNEDDHIETTYPGHAFVFCQRIKCDAQKLLRENQFKASFDEENNDLKIERKNLRGKKHDRIVVIESNERSIFLCNDAKEERNSNSGTKLQPSGTEWDAYLVVGGYRPSSDAVPSEDITDAENGEESIENEEEDSSSSDDDEVDLSVQLVTIKRIHTRAKRDIKENVTTQESYYQDDDPGPELVDCLSCIRSTFFRGADPSTKRKHSPAFVPVNDCLDSQNDDIDDTQYEVTVQSTKLDPTPIDTSKKQYDKTLIGGWPCRVEPGAFPNTAEGKALHRRIEADIAAAARCLPPRICEKLKRSTPFWINKCQSYGPKMAPVRARNMCFHPGSEWLVRNGMSPKKMGGVEIYEAKHYLSDCDLWGPGGLMLHELSHAWHSLHCKDSYDNNLIKQCYQKAMKEGLYDCVPVHGFNGMDKCKAYACSNQMEYFAELSVAFLGGLDEKVEHNKWFPFNRAQVKQHDPRAFDMLCRIWKMDGNAVNAIKGKKL